MAIATMLPKSRSRQTRFGDNSSLLLGWVLGELPVQASDPEPVRVPGTTQDLVVKIASTRTEWHEAFQLVADNYQARGYEEAGFDLRFTSYHALPDTATVVAKQGGRVVATFSLVPDNTLLGLPIEAVYRPEVQTLRRQGRRLAEVTNLAARDLGLRDFLLVFVTMVRLIMQYHACARAATAG